MTYFYNQHVDYLENKIPEIENWFKIFATFRLLRTLRNFLVHTYELVYSSYTLIAEIQPNEFKIFYQFRLLTRIYTVLNLTMNDKYMDWWGFF